MRDRVKRRGKPVDGCAEGRRGNALVDLLRQRGRGGKGVTGFMNGNPSLHGNGRRGCVLMRNAVEMRGGWKGGCVA